MVSTIASVVVPSWRMLLSLVVVLVVPAPLVIRLISRMPSVAIVVVMPLPPFLTSVFMMGPLPRVLLRLIVLGAPSRREGLPKFLFELRHRSRRWTGSTR